MLFINSKFCYLQTHNSNETTMATAISTCQSATTSVSNFDKTKEDTKKCGTSAKLWWEIVLGDDDNALRKYEKKRLDRMGVNNFPRGYTRGASSDY